MNKFDIIELIKRSIPMALCSVSIYLVECICFQWELTPLGIIEYIVLSIIINVLLTIWSKGR